MGKLFQLFEYCLLKNASVKDSELFSIAYLGISEGTTDVLILKQQCIPLNFNAH